MTPIEKAKELRSQFGNKAESICERMLKTMKRMKAPITQIEYWQSVKIELEHLWS